MNLVGRDRRPLEEGESYMGEGAVLRCPRRPVLAIHHAIVGRGTPECNSVPVVVGSHPVKVLQRATRPLK